MRLVMVSLAVMLPWLAGALLLRLCWPGGGPGARAFVVGYGYILGTIGVAALLGLQGALLGRLDPLPVLGLVGLLAAAAAWLLRRQAPPLPEVAYGGGQSAPQPRWVGAALWGLLGWLTLRSLSLAIEMFEQELYGWDAFTTWVFRARAWVESGQLLTAAFPDRWLLERSAELIAVSAPNYPILVSLIAAWPALAYGSWSEPVALLPWLLLFGALGAGLYGQCRRWGATQLESMVFVWLLLSLPLIGSHVAVGGYADLWLASTLGFAFMSFLLWIRDGEARDGLLALALVVIGMYVKAEGLVWALFFVPALLARWLRPRDWAVLFGLAALAAVALKLVGGLVIDLPVIGRVEIAIDRVSSAVTGTVEFRAESGVLQPLLTHFFVFDTWHLLIPVIVLGLAIESWRLVQGGESSATPVWRRAALAWVLTVVAACYLLFFWTAAAEWVRLGTSVNRIVLHFAPALVFWLQCLWVARRETVAPTV